MKNPTIKEYLNKGVWYDEQSQMIFSKTSNDGDRHIADLKKDGISVRGWGAIQYMFDNPDDAIRFQDSIGLFIVDAINEKLKTLK